MSAGLPKFVTVNLADLNSAFEDGAVVDLQAVQDKNLLQISGRDTKLGLKVRARVRACVRARVGVVCAVSSLACGHTRWAAAHTHYSLRLNTHTSTRTRTHATHHTQVLGEGKLSKKLTIKAASFSSSASEKIGAAGATAEVLPGRAKWTRKAHNKVGAAWRAGVGSLGLSFGCRRALSGQRAARRPRLQASAAVHLHRRSPHSLPPHNTPHTTHHTQQRVAEMAEKGLDYAKEMAKLKAAKKAAKAKAAAALGKKQ
jgi:ribosomal protein L15